jgi:hypothetical protein
MALISDSTKLAEILMLLANTVDVETRREAKGAGGGFDDASS